MVLKLAAAVRIDEQKKLVKAAFEKAVPKGKAEKPHPVDGQVVDPWSCKTLRNRARLSSSSAATTRGLTKKPGRSRLV